MIWRDVDEEMTFESHNHIYISASIPILPFVYYWSQRPVATKLYYFTIMPATWIRSCKCMGVSYRYLLDSRLAIITGLPLETPGIPYLSDQLTIRLSVAINTLGPRQNGRYFAVGISKLIFVNENCCVSIQISKIYLTINQQWFWQGPRQATGHYLI